MVDYRARLRIIPTKSAQTHFSTKPVITTRLTREIIMLKLHTAIHSNTTHRKPLTALFMVGALALGACSSSWVQVTPEGQGVRVATTQDIASCTRVGTANVNALDNIGFVQRGAARLQEELISLARNEGGRLGGNRVVPESTIEDGRQTFGVFRC